MLAGYKTTKNWFWGFEGNFMFTNQIKAEGLFDGLVDDQGNIFNGNGDVASVFVLGR